MQSGSWLQLLPVLKLVFGLSYLRTQSRHDSVRRPIANDRYRICILYVHFNGAFLHIKWSIHVQVYICMELYVATSGGN